MMRIVIFDEISFFLGSGGWMIYILQKNLLCIGGGGGGRSGVSASDLRWKCTVN